MDASSSLSINCKTGEALQIALKHRDEYTQHHCERVANIAVQTGVHLGFDDEALYHLETAAIFHDIGKIAIPDEILLNKGKLTTEQYDHMKTHAVVGANIAEKLDITNSKEVANIIRHHHEHYDGSGYPHNLKGEDIPLSSRIICIIDVFDALSSKRCYREPIIDSEKTLAKMAEEMLHQFDPHIFDIISKIIINRVISQEEQPV